MAIKRMTNQAAFKSLKESLQLERLGRLVLLVLIALLCWQLAMLFWRLVEPPKAPTVPVIPLTPAATPPAPSITQFALFAPPPPPPTSLVPSTILAPTANFSVPMKLEGVFVGNGASSSAVIQLNGKSSTYRIGQKLGDTGLRLAAVSWNQVIIRGEQGSGRARLRFGDSTPVVQTTAPSVSNQPISMGAAVSPSYQSPSTSYGSPASTTYPTIAGVNQVLLGQTASPGGGVNQQLQTAISQMSSNPTSYVNQMGLNSTGNGYEVTSAVSPKMLNQLGLKPGDRILSVNGQTIGNPQTDIGILRQVQQTRQATIQIQRGAQTLTLSQSF